MNTCLPSASTLFESGLNVQIFFRSSHNILHAELICDKIIKFLHLNFCCLFLEFG